MTSTNHMHRASAPGSGRLDLSLAGRRASRRTRSQRVAVVVAHVPPALLRSSSMEVLERPSAQDPAKSGHECLTRGTATMSRSRAHTHTRRWNPLRGLALKDEKSGQGTTLGRRRVLLRGLLVRGIASAGRPRGSLTTSHAGPAAPVPRSTHRAPVPTPWQVRLTGREVRPCRVHEAARRGE